MAIAEATVAVSSVVKMLVFVVVMTVVVVAAVGTINNCNYTNFSGCCCCEFYCKYRRRNFNVCCVSCCIRFNRCSSCGSCGFMTTNCSGSCCGSFDPKGCRCRGFIEGVLAAKK